MNLFGEILGTRLTCKYLLIFLWCLLAFAGGDVEISCPAGSWEDYIYHHAYSGSQACSLLSKFGFNPLHKSLKTWRFAHQQILDTFPVDPERRNFIRQVKNAVFSRVDPTPFKTKVQLAAYSDDALRTILDMSPQIANSSDFVEFAAGNYVLHGSKPKAHRYGGHQFGYWAGQLGDGRAHMLGEIYRSI